MMSAAVIVRMTKQKCFQFDLFPLFLKIHMRASDNEVKIVNQFF